MQLQTARHLIAKSQRDGDAMRALLTAEPPRIVPIRPRAALAAVWPWVATVLGFAAVCGLVWAVDALIQAVTK